MKKRICLAALLALVMAVVAVVGLVACTTNEDAAYYLTGKSTSWATYDKADGIPSAVKFAKGSDDDSPYTLTAALAANDELQIRKVGSSEVIGYSALVTTRQELTKGADDKIVVGQSGSYTFSLHVLDGSYMLSYTYIPENDPNPNPGPSDKTVEYVTINQYVEQLAVDGTYKFTANVGYSDDTVDTDSDKIVWSSSDATVATVDAASGVVTALKVGNTTITATYGDNISDEVELTVVDTIAVTGISLNEQELTLEIGCEETLIATIAPANASNKNVLWESSNELVATVDNDGKVSAVGSGEATITVTTVDGGKYATCTVHVVRHVTEIAVNSVLTVNVGGNGTITVSFTPANATNLGYTYEVSGDDKITVVDNNDGTLTVTGVATGSATVTVKSAENDTITATCDVTVVEAGEVVVALTETATLTKNGSAALTVSATNANITEIEWTSANDAIATVSGSGATATVTGVAYGMTTITAQISTDQGQYSKTCSVLVSDSYYYLVGSRWLDGTNWATYDSEAKAEAAGVLLTATARGVYAITLDLTTSDSFHICSDLGWGGEFKASVYFNSADSTTYASLVGNKDNIGVAYNGNYTITFNFTKGTPVIKVTANSIDVTDIDIAYEGNSTLNNGDTATLTATAQPTATTHTQFAWAIVEGGEQYVSISSNDNVCTVTVIGEPESGSVNVTISCTIGGVTKTQNIVVMKTGAQETPVSEINFAQASYEINVSVSTSGAVSAAVNADATHQEVTYSTEDSGITVDSSTGSITAKALGTFTVKATAVGDTSVYTTVKVLVYASEMIVYGGTNNWDTTGNTNFVVATEDDNSVWITTVTTSSASVYKFVIELGLDGGAIAWSDDFNLTQSNTTNDISADSYAGTNTTNKPPCYTISGENRMHRITVDLSGAKPNIIIEDIGVGVSSVSIDVDNATIATGASATLTAVINPANATYEASDIIWSVTSGSGTLSATTGETVTLTAGSEEETITVECTVKGVSASRPIVVANSSVAVSLIEFASATLTVDLNSGATVALPAITISPANATNTNVTYTSSSANLTVDDEGNITASGMGTFTVTVSATDGSGVEATCTVTVWSSNWQVNGGTGTWAYEDVSSATLNGSTITVTYNYTSGWSWFKFALMYGVNGDTTDWNYHLGNDNATLPSDASSSNFGVSDGNWYMTVGGSATCDKTLTVTIDISGDSPVVSSMVME